MDANADKVRWGFNRLMDGDIEALIALSHPDIEFIPLLTGRSGAAYIGHEGVRQWHADFESAFERIASTLESVTERGDLVLAEGELFVIGFGETPTARQSVSWLVEMHDGKATRLEVFSDRDEARRRAGLDQ